MTALRLLAALLLWLAAGRGLYRLSGASRLGLGQLSTCAAWLVGGAVVGGFVTTLLAVCGLPVRPWPVTAPVLGILAIGGALHRVDRAPRALRSEVPALFAALLTVPYLLAAASRPILLNDEYAIWAFKGKILTTLGRVDPFLLAHDQAYAYAHRDYPLLVPSIQVWVEGWLGHQDDRLVHLALALVIAAAFVLFVALVRQFAGLLAAVVCVVAVVATQGLPYMATLFLGDSLTCLLGLCLLATLAVAVRSHQGELTRPSVALAAVMAAGMAMTKNEGSAFAAAALIAAAVFFRSGRRRWLLLPAAAGLVALLPWALWSRLNGLNNDFVNTHTLRVSVIVKNFSRVGPLLHQSHLYWQGPRGVALAAVIVGAVLCVAASPASRRVVGFLLTGWLLAVGALLLTYLVSPDEGPGFWAASLPRVLLLPGSLLWSLGAVAGGALVTTWLAGRAGRTGQHAFHASPVPDAEPL